jgi:hypothetical protein
MNTRKRMLQALAVIAMASALGLTAKPASAATLVCTDICAPDCSNYFCGTECIELSCSFTACDYGYGNGVTLQCV